MIYRAAYVTTRSGNFDALARKATLNFHAKGSRLREGTYAVTKSGQTLALIQGWRQHFTPEKQGILK